MRPRHSKLELRRTIARRRYAGDRLRAVSTSGQRLIEAGCAIGMLQSKKRAKLRKLGQLPDRLNGGRDADRVVNADAAGSEDAPPPGGGYRRGSSLPSHAVLPFSRPSMPSAAFALPGPEAVFVLRMSTAAGWPSGPVTTLSSVPRRPDRD
jgi:hypothetical protein